MCSRKWVRRMGAPSRQRSAFRKTSRRIASRGYEKNLRRTAPARLNTAMLGSSRDDRPSGGQLLPGNDFVEPTECQRSGSRPTFLSREDDPDPRQERELVTFAKGDPCASLGWSYCAARFRWSVRLCPLSKEAPIS